MKNNIIYVFQDDNANYCFIVGTADAGEAESALRLQERVWYGEDESKWNGTTEKRMPFDIFYPTKIYSRGEFVSPVRAELPKGRGRIAERDGFMAPLD